MSSPWLGVLRGAFQVLSRWHPWRAVSVKLALVLAMFVAVPGLVYQRLSAADQDQNRLLIAGIMAQGRLAAEALRPYLDRADSAAMARLGEVVTGLGTVGPAIKLLYRPATGDTGFFYIASAPTVAATTLEKERQQLLELGVLDRLPASCEGAETVGFRYTNPDGAAELLTSLTSIASPAGCWVVITADRSTAMLATSLGRPYWQTAAVQAALLIYLAMAAAVMALLIQVRQSLHRFGRLSRDIRTGTAAPGRFAALNRVPELAGVAEEFDRLVETLRSSADALRGAAEETAHAFKTPLATITQSLEPLRRLPELGPSARRALDRIDRALARLGGLVMAARAIDRTLADTIHPRRDPVPLSALVTTLVAEAREGAEAANLQLLSAIDPALTVPGSAELLETVLQNLLDNAISFSPSGAAIEVTLKGRRTGVELTVADQGPGVPPETLPTIFDRFVSLRPAAGSGTAAPTRPEAHFGLGLWIVRRNVEALGGTVLAANRPEGGFQVTVTLPRTALGEG